MAARRAPGEYDQLHHFIADGPFFGIAVSSMTSTASLPPTTPSALWDAAPLEAELLVQGVSDTNVWQLAVLPRDAAHIAERHQPERSPCAG
jgi:hypothetical protein